MNNAFVTQEILTAFGFTSAPDQARSYGNGHINDTYLIMEPSDHGPQQYILQHLNTDVFRKPLEVTENILGITGWLRRKIISCGGDPDRETLTVYPASDGKPYFIDSDGNFWRVFPLIEEITSYDQVTCPEVFYQSALAFGRFQQMLSDYPAHELYETIPNFHNTPVRFENFEKAVSADSEKRVSLVPDEIAFVRAHEQYTHVLADQLANGSLPLRVTHNDTKLNNVLIDNHTGKGICIIDLDTVMPGLTAHDFGDAVRFGSSTAVEDEPDLNKVSCDLTLYEAYVKGFIEGAGASLTGPEYDSLIDGGIMMTLENGMRFLTDYLEGDHYYKIDFPEHNLRRARAQFKLAADMEAKRDQLEAIVARYKP